MNMKDDYNGSTVEQGLRVQYVVREDFELLVLLSHLGVLALQAFVAYL